MLLTKIKKNVIISIDLKTVMKTVAVRVAIERENVVAVSILW